MKSYYMIFITCLLTIPNIAISQSQNWISSFTKYEQTMSITADNAYLLKSDPSLDSRNVTIKEMNDSLLVVGHVDVDGQRFYMTEWSWSQYLKGKNPNWVLFPSESSNQDILDTANAVLAAFKNKDGKVLAALVHPTKGVRFSIEFSINLNTDQVFSRAKIKRLWTDRKIYNWGTEYTEVETTGTVRMRPKEYCERYILWTEDKLRNSVVEVNGSFGSPHRSQEGIQLMNAEMLKYPYGNWVEYNEIQMSDVLRLIFERVGQKWFLVGILTGNYSWPP